MSGAEHKLPRMLLDPQHPLSLRWRDLPELEMMYLQ
jgi:hypothetical protein